ncbi:hypothetical protein [Mesorhizobium sp. M0771]|uniref:hypothetical protein n=1 Tax=Mesorhizobium sp. M0771 TaxID=2956997 RepID=UPI00333D79DF
MTSGVFAVSRDIFEHHFFAAEPFTEREAWVWLIREAAWKARRVRVKDGMVALKRGQLASSVRFMADLLAMAPVQCRPLSKASKNRDNDQHLRRDRAERHNYL